MFEGTEVMLKDNTGGQIPMNPAMLLQWMQDNAPDKKELGWSGDELKQKRACEFLSGYYDFVRVRSLDGIGVIYYREKKIEDPNDDIKTDKDRKSRAYKKLSDAKASEMIRDAYKQLYRFAPAKKITSAMDTLKLNVNEEMEKMDNGLMEFAPGRFWDTDASKFLEEPSEPCVRELFDSAGTDEIQVKLDDGSVNIVRSMYGIYKKFLDDNAGYLVPDGDFIDMDVEPFRTFWTWADEDIEIFNDLFRAVASCFMKNKPNGSFILIGPTRNGKSTFIRMLHILFGRNNTSSVKLADFNDPHVNMTLATTMLNAPDEEDEGRGKELLRAQGIFKSVAAHEGVQLPVYYSQQPQWISTQFMCFFPMNHYPEWQGTGAAACMKRSLVIPFRADLSKYDNKGKDFVKDTFDSWFYANLLAISFALATYMDEHGFSLSERSEDAQDQVRGEVDSITPYIDKFKEFFDGYTQANLVYEDYKTWCTEQGSMWQSRKVFTSRLKMLARKDDKIMLGDELVTMHRISEGDGRRVFDENYPIQSLGGKLIRDVILGDNFNDERSVVGELDRTGSNG